MKSPTLMQQSRVRLAGLVIRDRMRPVSEAGVESLVASIAETGVMKDAIHVRKKKDGSLHLIAGAHRAAAARRLGWEEIEAKVWTDVTDDWARLMEIDDNLAGAEMNALDTAVFLAERKAVYERLHPEAKHGGDRRSPGFQTELSSVRSFAAATAEKFGLTDRQVRKIVAAGAALHPTEIDQLRAAKRPLRLVDLQALAKVGDAVERQRVVAAFAGGDATSIARARAAYAAEERGTPLPPKDPVDMQFLALANAWTRASAAARRRFLDEFAFDLALMPRPEVAAE